LTDCEPGGDGEDLRLVQDRCPWVATSSTMMPMSSQTRSAGRTADRPGGDRAQPEPPVARFDQPRSCSRPAPCAAIDPTNPARLNSPIAAVEYRTGGPAEQEGQAVQKIVKVAMQITP